MLGGTLLACPAALTRRARRGLEADHLHVGHVRLEAALHARAATAPTACSASRRCSTRPTRPTRRTRRCALQGAGARSTSPTPTPPTASSPTAGRPAALFAEDPRGVARSSTASSVMETARTLKDVSGVGLQLPARSGTRSKDDWFLGETFQLVKYNKAAGPHRPVGPLTDLDGKTASLSPTVAARTADGVSSSAPAVDRVARASMSVTTSRPSRVREPFRVAGVQVPRRVEAVEVDDDRRAVASASTVRRTRLIVPRPASATSTTSAGASASIERDASRRRRRWGSGRRPRSRPARARRRARRRATSAASSAIVNGGSPSASAAIGGAIGTRSQRCAGQTACGSSPVAARARRRRSRRRRARTTAPACGPRPRAPRSRSARSRAAPT